MYLNSVIVLQKENVWYTCTIAISSYDFLYNTAGIPTVRELIVKITIQNKTIRNLEPYGPITTQFLYFRKKIESIKLNIGKVELTSKPSTGIWM